MTRDEKLLLLILGGAGVAYWWASGSSSDPTSFAANPVASVTDAVTSAVSGWQNVGQGPVWVPAINAVEESLGIPANLLARVAYEESHFRDDIIRGTTVSPAGALGMMQLEPAYFNTVDSSVAIPYSDAAVQAQITQAGQDLVSQFETFGTWELALAAYNAGAGNVKKYGGIPPFPETQTYVAQIMADVPGAASA